MFRKLMALLIVPFTMVACVTGTISDTVDVDNSVSFVVPNTPVPASVGTVVPEVTVSQSTSVSVGNALTKINNIGTVGLSVEDNAITYNGSYAPFKNLTVNLTNLSTSATLMNYTFSGTETGTVHIPVLVNGSELYNILSNGPANLTFYLTVDPTAGSMPPSGTLTVDHHLALGVSANVSKGL